MRILANYGYKANGEMYSVTFETVGDVPTEHAPQAVDDLFRLAKEAVQRQLTSAAAQLQPQTAEGVTIPQPKVTPRPVPAFGNGRKPTIKDPALPATPKQLSLLKRLAREKSQWIEDLTNLTMGEASAKIDELRAA